MKRLHNLDYLRGICAFGIMLYHYSSWLYGNFQAKSPASRIGIYGVDIFYILSGLTLFHVYHNKMSVTVKDIQLFFKKRALRILPLLSLATIASIILGLKKPSLTLVLLNITGLFGVFKPGGYIATGAWSIGNELVFYLFFPLLILLAKKFKAGLWLLFAVSFAVFCYFSFYKISSHISLAVQWQDYINPLNQIAYFIAGFLISYCFQKRQINQTLNFALLIIGLGILFLWPATGDEVHLVTGYQRIIMTGASLLITIAFFKLSVEVPAFIDKPLAFLGEISYSLYLIHPLVFKLFDVFDKMIHYKLYKLKFGICVAGTIVVSYLVYTYMERYFMRLGAKKPSLSNPQ